ncbi:MAG: polysaccharide deacetylase [Thermodesulfobacteriota bacterium]
MSEEKSFPVLLTFDLDAETLWTARDPENAKRPIALSQGRYGTKIGADRVLRLLAKYRLPATFFIPGMVIEAHPDLSRRILEAGHEIGHHSYSHRWLDNLPPEEERLEMDRAWNIIKDLTGEPPRGYRSPAGEFTPQTFSLLLEYGFAYSSNFFDDEAPYKHVLDGRKTDLVELPFAWALDDAPFFLYSNRLVGRVMAPPSAVLETWQREFDVMSAEGKCYVLAMHPQIIGRGSRITILEELIRYILGHPRAYFSRCDRLVEEIGPRL